MTSGSENPAAKSGNENDSPPFLNKHAVVWQAKPLFNKKKVTLRPFQHVPENNPGFPQKPGKQIGGNAADTTDLHVARFSRPVVFES